MFAMNLKQSFSKSLTLAVLAMVAIPSLASAQQGREARANDTSDGYDLDGGVLSRILPFRNRFGRQESRKCPITSNVLNFKIATHPHDVATVYFKKTDGSVYYANKSEWLGFAGQCPSMNGKVKPLPGMYNVKEYGVIAHPGTEIVNFALNANGEFGAWGNRRKIVTMSGVRDVSQNSCYGQPLTNYNQKVLFVQLFDGRVFAIEEDGKTTLQPGQYRSIREFKDARNVCDPVGGRPVVRGGVSIRIGGGRAF